VSSSCQSHERVSQGLGAAPLELITLGLFCCGLQAPGSILGLTSTTGSVGDDAFIEASPGNDDQQLELTAISTTIIGRQFTHARHPLGDAPADPGMSDTVRAVAAACGAVGITRRVAAGARGVRGLRLLTAFVISVW
jgi:hypothetical protein